jgi:hypothetical protein
MNLNKCDYVRFKLDISRDRELYFLLDTGADVSIIKCEKLIGSTEFEPQEKVKRKRIHCRNTRVSKGKNYGRKYRDSIHISVSQQASRYARGWNSRKGSASKDAGNNVIRTEF